MDEVICTKNGNRFLLVISNRFESNNNPKAHQENGLFELLCTQLGVIIREAENGSYRERKKIYDNILHGDVPHHWN